MGKAGREFAMKLKNITMLSWFFVSGRMQTLQGKGDLTGITNYNDVNYIC